VAITVLLADDHRIVREGTHQLLEQYPDLLIIGEAHDGEETIRLANQLHPDVIVMDVRMPGLSGIEATRILHACLADTKILILSAYDEDHYVFPLLEAGASGYLLKTSSGAELAEAIRIINKGGTALNPQIAGRLVNRIFPGSTRREHSQTEPLTSRELEVLRLAAHGKSNKAIGVALAISPQTVQVHLRNLFGKLGVSSRSEAVAYALCRGWIQIEAPDE